MSSLREKMLSCAMAAKQLGFSAAHVRRLCSQGKIDAIKQSHDWIIPITSLNAYIKRRTKQPKE
jgi:hypothetical protein